MSEFEKLASEQIGFETERMGTDKSLWDKNRDMDFASNRLFQEVYELREALLNNHTSEQKLDEAADVIIFATSIAAHICVENGLPLDKLTETIFKKMEQNGKKYDQNNFPGKTVDEAMHHSRIVWKK